MVANHHFTRIDTLALKDLMYRKIGHERAENYFDQLKKFVCLKLNKIDFDKSCIQTIGRANISLHNKLIRSIAHNACHSKIPPQKPRKVEARSTKVADGVIKTSLGSIHGYTFPRKCRSSVNRDRKLFRPSPLGPLGKSPSTMTCEETGSRIQDQQNGPEFHSLCSDKPLMAVEDGEEVEQFAQTPNVGRWSSIFATHGISVKTRCARKTLYCSETCESSGELPDTRSLRGRLEKKLLLEGIGVSLDGANLLNNSLDVFLKILIERCVGISAHRHSNCEILSGFSRKLHGKYASMLDFQVAMESNPHILGQDWSIQLEKISN